ncbi:MAG: CPBP family intramembrane metalloprotease [Bacteroidetes bacterium]|nr:CPBP family intramembrane metalloprotease [Bacteroidota bacterium]
MTADRNSRNFSFPSQLGIFLALLGAGVIIGALVSAGIWSALTGRPLLSIQSDMMNPKYYNAIMLMQAADTIIMFFLPVYFFALICYKNPSQFIGFKTSINYKQLFWVLIILVFTFPLSSTLADLTNMIPIPKNLELKFKAMESDREAQEAALININTFSKYIISLLLIGVLPGLVEEVFFRGGLQNILMRWFKGPWFAIILTSVIFSIIHLSYYGFFVRAALGAILGLIFYYTGSLWLSILVHFLYNGIQVTGLYLTSGSIKKVPKDIEQSFPLWLGLAALFILVFAFKKLKEISIAQQQKFVYEPPKDPNDFHDWIAGQS